MLQGISYEVTYTMWSSRKNEYFLFTLIFNLPIFFPFLFLNFFPWVSCFNFVLSHGITFFLFLGTPLVANLLAFVVHPNLNLLTSPITSFLERYRIA